MTLHDKLKRIYTDAGHEAGFGSISKLARAAHESREKVKQWLLDQESYSLHFPARRRFKRNPIVATSIGELCQADVVDMSAFASENDGFKYLLTFIDVFSKQASAVPLKNKSGGAIKKAFETIFASFTPRQIQTDRGLEFKNQMVMDFMKRNNVHLYFSHNQDIKAAVAERFNRTLKSRMFRFFTHSGSRRYLDILPAMLDSYNRSYHRSIRMRPVDVAHADPNVVFRNLYRFKSKREMLLAEPQEQAAFSVGDKVRLRYHIDPLSKSFYPNFTDQVFTITHVIRSAPRIMYQVKDFQDRVLSRRLYKEDMLLIPPDPKYRIERIIRRRKRRGVEEVFVKFVNYPDSANQWIPASSVEDVV